MKVALVILVFMAGLLSVNKPKIKFENTILQADTLLEGRSFNSGFKFYNTGDEPLIISRSMAAAGNVVSSHPKEPIAPGDSGEIKFTMSTIGRVGPFVTSIAVISNTEKERTTLLIKGYIKKKDEE